MKLLILVFGTIFLTTNALFSTTTTEEKWNTFKLEHKKHYKDSKEEETRLKAFIENLSKIQQHNKLYEQGLKSYKLGVNKFADLTHEEFASNYLQSKPQPTHNNESPISFVGKISNGESQEISLEELYKKYPQSPNEDEDNFDWRDHGAITPVQDQKTCGSWPFVVTGVIESMFFIQNNETRNLSEQQLIDCIGVSDNCNSVAFVVTGYSYVIDNGLLTDDEYPYTAEQVRCKNITTNRDDFHIIGFVVIRNNNTDALLNNVGWNGPNTVLINGNYLPLYESGIISEAGCTSDDLNHNLLVVGYGVENELQYWIAKNSWGTSWGEDGYVRIARNQSNMCGIGNEATYPMFSPN